MPVTIVGYACHRRSRRRQSGSITAASILHDEEGYTVLEVNGTPNWHCMAAPIPELLARYLIQEERKMRA